MRLVLFLSILMSTVVAAEKKLPEFFKRTKTNITNPFEMRDPFKRKAVKLKSTSTKDYKLDKTIFSNLPTLDGVPLDQIKITGVILGDERRAIAKIASEQEGAGAAGDIQTYIIKEGMKLGFNQAEVKAILPGGIVLVEKIKNVYDQEEYIETIMPVTVE
ncbi:MAG: hypothetical protein CME71_05635 [Halobacteriovorax sp.]|mgnify:FL=1|nr:hypothetical protein [Halobacteriovorax sp.]